MVRLLVVDTCECSSLLDTSPTCPYCGHVGTVTSIDGTGLRDTLDDVLPSVVSEYVDARLNDDPEEADRTGENMRTLQALAAALGETDES